MKLKSLSALALVASAFAGSAAFAGGPYTLDTTCTFDTREYGPMEVRVYTKASKDERGVRLNMARFDETFWSGLSQDYKYSNTFRRDVVKIAVSGSTPRGVESMEVYLEQHGRGKGRRDNNQQQQQQQGQNHQHHRGDWAGLVLNLDARDHNQQQQQRQGYERGQGVERVYEGVCN